MADSSNCIISNSFFQQIIDELPTLLFWTDVNHIIVGNNVAHAKAFGYSSTKDVIGLHY
jgi:PAS domain-containing protein